MKQWKDVTRFDIWPLVGKVDQHLGYTFTQKSLFNALIKNIHSIESELESIRKEFITANLIELLDNPSETISER